MTLAPLRGERPLGLEGVWVGAGAQLLRPRVGLGWRVPGPDAGGGQDAQSAASARGRSATFHFLVGCTGDVR